jgi:hypothetical protein
MRDRILHLARTRYVGFNDHHLCEKLGEIEAISLGRRRSAVCSARTVSAPPRNGALLRTASVVFAALARAKCSS